MITHESDSFVIATLSFPREANVVHSDQRRKMLLAQYLHYRLHHLDLQLLGLLPLTVVPVRRCQLSSTPAKLFMLVSMSRYLFSGTYHIPPASAYALLLPPRTLLACSVRALGCSCSTVEIKRLVALVEPLAKQKKQRDYSVLLAQG